MTRRADRASKFLDDSLSPIHSQAGMGDEDGDSALIAAADIEAARRKLSGLLDLVIDRRREAESSARAGLDSETVARANALRNFEARLRDVLEDREFLAFFDIAGKDAADA